mgnify:CR=1 FL=1|tara:strand:- start:1612 stop:1776 length:165 start_codon:yes stop_codon:yes gene_type:complete
MKKEVDINALMYRLNRMLDSYEHKMTGKSLFTIQKERKRREKEIQVSIVNNNNK